MFDARLRPLIDPPLNRLGRMLSSWGMAADTMTLLGLLAGLATAVAVALSAPVALALLALAASRIADGLDGAIARARGKTDFGGYLDIFCDFVFYGAVPLAFALRDPQDALVAAFLLFSFYVNAASFLGHAILAEKLGLKTEAQGQKSFFYAAGLLEGAETIVFFAVVIAVPTWFAPLAAVFGALCLWTAFARVFGARHLGK